MSDGITADGGKRAGPSKRGLRFGKTILVRVDGRWHVVETADQALQCLRGVLPDKDGPSYRRALAVCQATLRGDASTEGAQATFIVAVMEGGHPFEVHDAGADLEERLVAAATENGLLDMLLELDEDRTSSKV